MKQLKDYLPGCVAVLIPEIAELSAFAKCAIVVPLQEDICKDDSPASKVGDEP